MGGDPPCPRGTEGDGDVVNMVLVPELCAVYGKLHPPRAPSRAAVPAAFKPIA